MIELIVNQARKRYDGDPAKPLLWYLREDLGLMGTRFGCGIGVCGCCTVHSGKDAIRACVTPMEGLQGAAITTIEGLGQPGKLHPVQQAWVKHAVPQCGYCQSGQIMQACALLATNPKPTNEDIDGAMAANLCRCGTYPRIRVAIRSVADAPQKASR